MLRRYVLTTASVALVLSPAFAAAPAKSKADGPAQPKVAASRVISVTVYPNSALVTREVDVPEGAGPVEVVVSPLPPQTVNSSLYSEGTDGFRILTTRFRMRPILEDTREEVRKAEAELRRLQLEGERLQSDSAVVQQDQQMLTKLENFTGANLQAQTEKGKLDSDAIMALAKYVMESRGDKAQAQVALQQKLQANREQIEFVQRRLKDLSAGSTRTERDAVIVIDKRHAEPGKVRLNYLVDSASWRPQYKFHAARDRDPIQVEYLAAVTQHTGEDWRNVQIVLSTAQPMLNAAPPDLKMLEVALVPRGAAPGMAGGAGMGGPAGGAMGRMPAMPGMPGTPGTPGGGPSQLSPPAMTNQPTQTAAPFGTTPAEFDRAATQFRAEGQKAYNEKKGDSANQLYNYAGALDQAKELLVTKEEDVKKLHGPMTRATSGEGPSITYHLPTRLSVPSRQDEQVIEVTRIDMKPDYYYKAVPVLTSHVYRLADLTNKSEYVLLPGEATMYIGADFVGRTELALVAIGEQFTAGFGVDPQLQVQRQMTDKTRTVQGDNQVLKFEYRILVSSYKAEPVKLQVWDRLPHADTEAVGVSLVKATPEVSTDPLYQRECRPHNLLRWDLNVEPTMNGEKALAVKYEFKLELGRQMMIGNFQTR